VAQEPSSHGVTSEVGGLQHVVVGLSLTSYLNGHAVEALRNSFRSRKRHVGNGARDTLLPSSQGSIVTNHRRAIAALMSGSIFPSVLYQSRKAVMSVSIFSAIDAS
jgi:hypothetical protein